MTERKFDMTKDKSAQKRARAKILRNRWWAFDEIGIEQGVKLVHKATSIECTVGVGKQQVVYDGQTYDWLYQLAVKLKRWRDKDPSAPEQFVVKGSNETLAARRKRYAE